MGLLAKFEVTTFLCVMNGSAVTLYRYLILDALVHGRTIESLQHMLNVR